MSIVVIGDRATGKTSMVRAISENGKYVKVADGKNLASELYNPDTKEIAGTQELKKKTLIIDVDLPASGIRKMNVLWVDTPGEFWTYPQQRKDYPGAWQEMEKQIKQSKAVILLLPPYQGLVTTNRIQLAATHLQPIEPLPTSDQWVNRLKYWLSFFDENCQRVKHIIIALHKADLFCDVEVEGNRWQYRPDWGGAAPWYEYSEHVVGAYFGVANQVIRQYKATPIGARTLFFISTTENQELLELPWLYLAPYLIYN